ncbi:MAG: transpeptidase family protein [Bacteriovoracaceae bacterium]|nr:transpeptidase family protein [Bacteriovoracaceae bacterium]
MKNRIFFSFIVFAFLFAVVVSKAFYIQVVNKAKLLAYAKSQFIREVKEYPNRGNIFDRNGNPLAINVHVYNLFTIPKNKNAEFYRQLKSLSQIVPELPYQKLRNLVQKRNRYTWLARKITLNEEQLKKIKKLEGIFFESHSQRVYPNRELLAQTLGYVGIDNTGLAGLENSLNTQLKGKPQVVKYIRDAKGRPIKYETKASEVASPDVHLSIDKDIQGALESYLKDAVTTHKAFRGGAGVMDAETGEILAIANYPTFDPNKASTFPQEYRKLPFVTDPFEPGSIFKMLTVASALENKIATPETKFFCEYGKIKIQNHWVSEAETHEKFEWLTVSDILKFSSNVGTTKIAFSLKYPKFRGTLDKFQIGQKTGIEIKGESKGILSYKADAKVRPLTLSTISFGQGVATTAIQMLRSYAAVANGGYLVKPTLIRTNESQLKPENRIISEKTANEVTKMLVGAVDDGTGTIAKIPHYVVAGKTGTAQRVSPTGGYSGYVANFVGFPVNVNRKFVVLAYVDNPTENGYYGGKVAGPIFKKITQYILYKKKDFAQFAKYDEKSNTKNLDEVKTQQAQQTRYFAPGYMPDFTGLDKASAMQLAEERNITLQFNGFGVVTKQSIPPGTSAVGNTSLRLQFEAPTYAE